MPVRFIHTADSHLGKTYGNSPGEATRYKDFFRCLSDIVKSAVDERVDFFLMGGDLFHTGQILPEIFARTIGARVAFFDEPTSNLDAARRANLAHAFRAIDVGRDEVTEHWYDQLFLISHDVAFTEVTDQIISIEKELSVT